MSKYKALLSVAVIATVLAVPFVASAAPTYTLDPWLYDPDATGSVVAEETPSGGLRLEKNAPTPTNSAAGAEILGVAGLSTTNMVISFDVDGYCGAGAPRLNVYLVGIPGPIFLGCTHGNDGLGHVTFEAGNTYGGVLFPEGAVISGIEFVQDEEGQTTLSNILINGDEAGFEEELPPSYPVSKENCKNGGWKNYTQDITFKNQGQCIAYVQSSSNSAHHR